MKESPRKGEAGPGLGFDCVSVALTSQVEEEIQHGYCWTAEGYPVRMEKNLQTMFCKLTEMMAGEGKPNCI